MTDHRMTDQAPEPQVLAKLLRVIAGGTDAQASKHDVIFLAAANWLERWNTHPTPSERPVAQVREAVVEIAKQKTSDQIAREGILDPDECDFVGAHDTMILIARRALTSERPSEVAVAWQWRACISGRWGAWLKVDEPIERFREKQAEHLRDGIFEVRPLYAIPREAVARTEEERHDALMGTPKARPSEAAVARTCATCHAVLADGPQPAATYDAIPHGDAVREKRSAPWICCHCDAPLSCAACGVEQPNDSEYYAAMEAELKQLRALSPTLASERVNKQEPSK